MIASYVPGIDAVVTECFLEIALSFQVVVAGDELFRDFAERELWLLAAFPNRSYLEAHGFGLDRYIEHPLALDEGMALAPARPGHGSTFDWKGLAQLAQ